MFHIQMMGPGCFQYSYAYVIQAIFLFVLNLEDLFVMCSMLIIGDLNKGYLNDGYFDMSDIWISVIQILPISR